MRRVVVAHVKGHHPVLEHVSAFDILELAVNQLVGVRLELIDGAQACFQGKPSRAERKSVYAVVLERNGCHIPTGTHFEIVLEALGAAVYLQIDVGVHACGMRALTHRAPRGPLGGVVAQKVIVVRRLGPGLAEGGRLRPDELHAVHMCLVRHRTVRYTRVLRVSPLLIYQLVGEGVVLHVDGTCAHGHPRKHLIRPLAFVLHKLHLGMGGACRSNESSQQ